MPIFLVIAYVKKLKDGRRQNSRKGRDNSMKASYFRRKYAGAIAASVALVIATVAVPAASAWADPSGCGKTISFTGVHQGSGYYLLKASGTGNCQTNANRSLRVEIKAHKALSPDPLVAYGLDTKYATSYSETVTSCDNRNKKDYYGRVFWTSHVSDHADTSRKNFQAC